MENIGLLGQSRANGFVGVNLYVDDEGSIKGLPRNLRATELAHCVGKPIEVRALRRGCEQTVGQCGDRKKGLLLNLRATELALCMGKPIEVGAPGGGREQVVGMMRAPSKVPYAVALPSRSKTCIP